MKLAYSSNAYMRYGVVDAVRRIATLGFRGCELMADAPHVWPVTTTDEDIAAIRGALDSAGLEISNVNAFMMSAVGDFWHPSWIEPDAAFRRMRLEHTQRALVMARKLGAPCITTEPGGPLEPSMSRDRAMDVFVGGLAEALETARREHVMLLVEPEPGLLIENARQFEELAERIDSPMFGLNFDIGHFYCVGADLPATIARLAAYAKHYHAEDIAATRVHEHLIPGHGAIEFESTLKAITRTGFDGWITVELYPYLDDPDAAGREAHDFLKSKCPA